MKSENKLVTRNEFRSLCGHEDNPMSANTLRTDIKRGHVVETEDKLIDISHPKNVKYIEDRRKYEQEKFGGLRSAIDSEKKKIELAKAKEDLQMKKLQRLKMEGELIPTDIVKLVFKSHLKEVYQQLYFACEQISADTIRKMGGSKTDISDMKGNLVAVLNGQIQKARESSALKIKEIKNEYRSISDAKK